MHFDQIGLLLAEATVVAALLLSLFHRRGDWGLTPLFVAMGVFQHMQVVLATSVYVEVAPGVVLSPGSVVLFTATLFAVLLVYIHEDALEARKLIYGLIMANISLAALSFAAGLHVRSPATINEFNLPPEFFASDLRVMIVGTLCLFFDTILVIVVYEALSHRWLGSFFRLFLTVTGVLCFDQFLFATGAFAGTDEYTAKLVSGLIGKVFSGLFYSLVLWTYLRWSGNKSVVREPGYSWDVFQLLSYRQKFDLLGKEYDVLEERVRERTVKLDAVNRSLQSEIAGHKRTEATLREREQRLEALSRELLELQETERRNLARELHDEIGQLLTVIKMQMMSGQQESCDTRANLESAIETVDATIKQVRSLSLRLRPSILDDFGLIPALEWQAEQTQLRTGLVVDLTLEGESPRLSSPLETMFFRVAQEALTNAMRHSGAKTVSISFECDNSIATMTITDDGCGFDVSKLRTRSTGGLGLSGMRERVEVAGGVLTIRSEPRVGTHLFLSCQVSGDASG